MLLPGELCVNWVPAVMALVDVAECQHFPNEHMCENRGLVLEFWEIGPSFDRWRHCFGCLVNRPSYSVKGCKLRDSSQDITYFGGLH